MLRGPLLLGNGLEGKPRKLGRATAALARKACIAASQGISELVLAVRLRREIPGELMLGFSGGVSILLGVLMLTRPVASAFVIVVLLGSYALCFGAALLLLAFRLRRRTSSFEGSHHLRSSHGTA